MLTYKLSIWEKILKAIDTAMMPSSTEVTTLSLNLSHLTNTLSSWPLRTESSRENSTHSLKPTMLLEEIWTERIRSLKSDNRLTRSFTNQLLISNKDHQEETDHLPSMTFNNHLATKSTLPLEALLSSKSSRRLSNSTKPHTTDMRETRRQTT